jgi:hypothetical protein
MTRLEPPNPSPILSVPTLKVCEPALRTGRDERGRFLTGNSGGGRRPGSRNKLTETFLGTIANDFAEHGAEAIARVRKEDPVTYLKLIAWFVPRELILQREQEPDVDLAELSEAEVVELLETERRRAFLKSALKSVSYVRP